MAVRAALVFWAEIVPSYPSTSQSSVKMSPILVAYLCTMEKEKKENKKIISQFKKTKKYRVR